MTQQLQIMSISLEHESFVAKIMAIINERLQSSAQSELQKMFTSKIEVLNSAPFHYTKVKDPCYQLEEPLISFNSLLSRNLRSQSLRFFNDYVTKRACEEVSLSKWSIHMIF